MKQYRIIASDPSTWGNNVTDTTIIDDVELDILSREWRNEDDGETAEECRARLLLDLEEV